MSIGLQGLWERFQPFALPGLWILTAGAAVAAIAAWLSDRPHIGGNFQYFLHLLSFGGIATGDIERTKKDGRDN